MSARTSIILSASAVLVLAGLSFYLASAGSTRELAAFSTSLAGRTPEQLQNLRVALAGLSGTRVRPGEIFSLNAVLGERLRSRGYREAPTLWKGSVVDTPGGGLCQLSSTLYNAALLAGLAVVERHPHLYAVQSVGPGRDATILYDRLDLRVRNTRPDTVTIGAEIRGNLLIARILGQGEPPPRVEIRVETLQRKAPSALPRAAVPGAASGRAPLPGTPGVKVRVWRVVNPGGRDETREFLSEDDYASAPSVGPGGLR